MQKALNTRPKPRTLQMTWKPMLADDRKTEQALENEVLGEVNDLEAHSLHPQQDRGFPKEYPCTLGGPDAQVVSEQP
jgi:hypothetical protein